MTHRVIRRGGAYAATREDAMSDFKAVWEREQAYLVPLRPVFV
jgi:hypothetical protein